MKIARNAVHEIAVKFALDHARAVRRAVKLRQARRIAQSILVVSSARMERTHAE